MSIKLVNYKDYTEMHGQQNVKIKSWSEMPSFADDYITKIFRNLMSPLLKAAYCSEIFVSTQNATGVYKTEEINMNDQYRKQ